MYLFVCLFVWFVGRCGWVWVWARGRLGICGRAGVCWLKLEAVSSCFKTSGAKCWKTLHHVSVSSKPGAIRPYPKGLACTPYS